MVLEFREYKKKIKKDISYLEYLILYSKIDISLIHHIQLKCKYWIKTYSN